MSNLGLPPKEIREAAQSVETWFNQQNAEPNPRWEFLGLCSRNYAQRVNVLEQRLKLIQNQIDLITKILDPSN